MPNMGLMDKNAKKNETLKRKQKEKKKQNRKKNDSKTVFGLNPKKTSKIVGLSVPKTLRFENAETLRFLSRGPKNR